MMTSGLPLKSKFSQIIFKLFRLKEKKPGGLAALIVMTVTIKKKEEESVSPIHQNFMTYAHSRYARH